MPRSKSFTFGHVKNSNLYEMSALEPGLSLSASVDFQPQGPSYPFGERFNIVDKAEISQELSGGKLVDYTNIDNQEPCFYGITFLSGLSLRMLQIGKRTLVECLFFNADFSKNFHFGR